MNTAVAQAYYALKEGKSTLSTETGAGQWGTALAYAARLLDLQCVSSGLNPFTTGKQTEEL
jgi:tryptophan synthase beta chain